MLPTIAVLAIMAVTPAGVPANAPGQKQQLCETGDACINQSGLQPTDNVEPTKVTGSTPPGD